MRGLWRETNWQLDGESLVLPNGQRVRLHDVRQWQADRIEGRHDLFGYWSGWRVRQQWLIAPGGTVRRGRIAQHVLQHVMLISAWEEPEANRRQLRLF